MLRIALALSLVFLCSAAKASSPEWTLKNKGDWDLVAIESSTDFAILSLTCAESAEEDQSMGMTIDNPLLGANPPVISLDIDGKRQWMRVKTLNEVPGTIFLSDDERRSGLSANLVRQIRNGKMLRVSIPFSVHSKVTTWNFSLRNVSKAIRFLEKQCGVRYR